MLSTGQTISVYSVLPPLNLGEPFGHLVSGSKERFVRLSTPHDFPEGNLIFDENAEPARVWYLVSGSAELHYPAGHGMHAASRSVSAGDVLGLTETLARISYQATLRAVTQCRFRSLGYEALNEFLRDEPATCAALLETLARDYYQGYLKLLSRS